jgi:hypothetical protein
MDPRVKPAGIRIFDFERDKPQRHEEEDYRGGRGGAQRVPKKENATLRVAIFSSLRISASSAVNSAFATFVFFVSLCFLPADLVRRKQTIALTLPSLNELCLP